MRSLHIELPDATYAEAVQAASERGLSVETFVADFMRFGLADNENYAPLTPTQLRTIEEAEAAIDAGDFFTAEQVRDRLVSKSMDWKSSNRL